MGQIFHLNLEYWFNFADSDGDSCLTGNDAMKIFAMSNLSRPELKQLSWEHCWLLWSLFWALIRSWHPSILLHFWVICCAMVTVLIALVASSPTKGWSGRSLNLLDPCH
ncbi:uncharacterized protein [Coffea arabica]|uniref:Uncharacterized protein isoform X4 n=1 Tax=Coffea arabica TaxID=13443 RepID=A0ABM4UBB0_COFAR